MKFRVNLGVGFRWLNLALLTLVGVLGSSLGTAAELTSLDLGNRVERVHLAGDNAFVVGVLSGEKTVVVVDAEKFEEVTRFDVPGAGPIFSRAGQLYVSNQESGLIQVYSEKTWELVNEIDSGVKNLRVIAARRGDDFGSEILVSSNALVNLVDVEKDTFETLQEGASDARFSADGETVIDKKNSKFRAFSTKEYFRGAGAKLMAICDSGTFSDPEPIVDEFWLGRANQICVGMPPFRAMKPAAKTIILDGDPTSGIVYLVTPSGDAVEVRRLDENFSLVQRVELPKSKIRFVTNLYPGMRCSRRNADGSVTLFWTGFHVQGISAFTFSYSEPLQVGSIGVQRIPLPDAAENVLVSGPDGTELTEDSVLVWNPGAEVAAGSYTFKVKQTIEGKVSFFRKTIKVDPPSEPSGPKGRIPLKLVPSRMTPQVAADAGSDRIALLDDDRLLVFGKDAVLDEVLLLQKTYAAVACLADGYALGGKNLVELTGRAGKVKKTIDLGGVEILKMAVDRTGRHLFVTCKDPTVKDLAKSLPIYKVDLVSAKAERMPRVFGGDVHLGPAGDQMISSISHSQIHWVGISNYYEETADLLMSYQLDDGTARLHRAFTDSLKGIGGASFSPDGSLIAVKANQVPSRGQMVRGYVPIFSSNNLEKPKRLIAAGNRQIKSVEFHPKLDLLFVLSAEHNGGQIKSFLSVCDGDGNFRDNLFAEDAILPVAGDFLMVAPGGEDLLVRGQDIYGRSILQRMSLRLNESERKKNLEDRPAAVPVFSNSPGLDPGKRKPLDGAGGAVARGLSPSQVKTLSRDSSRMKEINPELMGHFMMPAVVIVNGGDHGIGAGFFVSNDGHIVTAAHCLPDLGGPEVFHYANLPFERLEFGSQATVIDIDEARDLALIKIDCNANMPSLSLSSFNPGVGAKAFAIGHPGVENISLDYTLTSGLVSSAVRELNGQKLLQISAPVNPGNSGGPVLDNRGNVIGMVSQKAALEGASFAVPASLIAEFLKRSQSKIEPERPDLEKISGEVAKKGWLTLDKLTFKGGRMRAAFKDEEKKWFTGTLAVLGNPLDHVLVSVQYKDGYPHGNCIQFDRNGRKVKTTSYRNGEKNGVMTTWYPSGNPSLEINLRNGKSSGFSREYADEKYAVREAACFEDGILHGFSYRMDELGRVVLSTFHKEGKGVSQSRFNHYDQVAGVPIIEFTKVGDVEMVEKFVKQGASIDTKDKSGTVLHVAVAGGFHYVVRAILELGADPDIKNEGGFTPLAVVMAKDKADITLAKILIDGGASKEGLSKNQLDLLK